MTKKISAINYQPHNSGKVVMMKYNLNIRQSLTTGTSNNNINMNKNINMNFMPNYQNINSRNNLNINNNINNGGYSLYNHHNY
jgi:hypothetical protein